MRHRIHSAWRETPGDSQTDGDFGGRGGVWFLRNTDGAWVEEERELGQTYNNQLGFNSTLKRTPQHTHGHCIKHNHNCLHRTNTFKTWCSIGISVGTAVCPWGLRGNPAVHIDDTLIRDGEVLNDTLQYHFLKNFEASNIPF